MPPALRLVVTVVVPLIVFLLSRITLPGIDLPVTPNVPLPNAVSFDPSLVSVVALGLLPIVTAFVLVEIVAAILPPLRPLRRNGPAGRRSLRRASVALALLMTFVQGFFIARYFESLSQRSLVLLVPNPGAAFQLVLAATLTGATALLLSLSWIVDHFGLGNGVSLLLGEAALSTLAGHATADVRTLLSLALVAAATGALLTFHRRRAGALRDPITGAIPLFVAASFWSLFSRLSAWGLPIPAPDRPDSIAFAVTHCVLLALLAVPFAFAFQRGISRDRLLPALGRATAWLVLVALVALSAGDDALCAVTATAVGVDLVLEWRLRQHAPTLVAVWPLPSVASIDPALARLRAAGIYGFVRAAHHRALLQFFGPYLELDLLVPLARAEEAQALLG
ncbi:MAG: Preprotein translocase secY subunit [Myxococcales bacterium]|nr:Preprotein translocase secY subunit [Myxococcales bacterium]